MRTLVIIFWIISLMTLNSCKQETETKALLQNSETRTEILNAIASDHNFMMEFMEVMHGNKHAMQMMQGNKMMMGNMMEGNGMKIMMDDSAMMKNMMQGIMKDGKMTGNMMQMMHDEGVMSEECLMSGMKMMTTKE